MAERSRTWRVWRRFSQKKPQKGSAKPNGSVATSPACNSTQSRCSKEFPSGITCEPRYKGHLCDFETPLLSHSKCEPPYKGPQRHFEMALPSSSKCEPSHRSIQSESTDKLQPHHLTGCHIRTPSRSRNGHFVPCDWKGSYSALVDHVTSSHPDHLVCGEWTEIATRVYVQRSCLQSKLLLAHDQIFWCVLAFNPGRSELLAYVRHLSTSGQYRNGFEFANDDHQLTFYGRTIGMLEDAETSSEVFHVSKEVVKMLRVDGVLKCRVSVSMQT